MKKANHKKTHKKTEETTSNDINKQQATTKITEFKCPKAGATSPYQEI